MSKQDIRVEAVLNIRCIVKRLYHLCRSEVNVGELFTANKKRGERRNAFTAYKALFFYVSISFPSIYNQSIPI